MKAIKQQFKPTTTMISAAKSVFMAKAFVATMRSRVEPIQQALIDLWKPVVDKASRFEEAGKPITNWNHLYLASEDDWTIIFKDYDARLRENGLLKASDAEGICPLLQAEHVERIASKGLVTAMEPITGITHDMIWSASNAIENYKQYVDLSLKLLAPYVKA